MIRRSMMTTSDSEFHAATERHPHQGAFRLLWAGEIHEHLRDLGNKNPDTGAFMQKTHRVLKNDEQAEEEAHRLFGQHGQEHVVHFLYPVTADVEALDRGWDPHELPF